MACDAAYPCESVSSISELWTVTRHGIPAMGWILAGLLIIVAIALLIVYASGVALKLKIPHFGIPIGVVIMLYGFSPPLVAAGFLVSGIGAFGFYAGKWMWTSRKRLSP